MKRLPVLQDKSSLILEDPKEKRHDPTTGTTDNSNTHFAIIGLWAARKHDVPVRSLVRPPRATLPIEPGTERHMEL